MTLMSLLFHHNAAPRLKAVCVRSASTLHVVYGGTLTFKHHTEFIFDLLLCIFGVAHGSLPTSHFGCCEEALIESFGDCCYVYLFSNEYQFLTTVTPVSREIGFYGFHDVCILGPVLCTILVCTNAAQAFYETYLLGPCKTKDHRLCREWGISNILQ